LDFGARMYDSRLGRWLSLDPLAHKYIGWSPYSFSLSNPIYLKDADGNVVVDRTGNPVTVSYEKDASGKYVASFAYAPGTSKETIAHFENNGGRLINVLLQIPTGRQMVDKVIASEDKIHTRVIPAKGNKPVGNKEGLVLGKTVYLPNFGLSGAPAFQVTVEEASIKQAIKDYKDPAIKSEPKSPAGEMVNNNLTDEQQVGAVTGHEWEHATNPVDVGEIKSGKDIPKNDPRHQPAYDKGTQISNEFGELNKTKR